MMGDLRCGRGAYSRCLLERAGVCGVESHPFPGEQFSVDRVAHEGVPELVCGVVDREDARGDRVPGRRVDLGVGFAAGEDGGEYGGQQRMLDPHPAGGQQPQQILARLRQRGVVAEEDVAETRGQVDIFAIVEIGELFDEERDSAGSVVEQGERPGARHGAPDGLDHLPHFFRAEPWQAEQFDTTVPAEFGEPPPKRVGPADLVAAVAQQEEDAVVLDDPHEEAEQAESGLVRPVDVLDHDHQGVRLGELFEGYGDSVVEPAGVTPLACLQHTLAPELGEQHRQGAPRGTGRLEELLIADGLRDGAQELDHRGEGGCVQVEVDALTPADDRIGGQILEEVVEQAGLADPRLAADDDGSGLGAGTLAIDARLARGAHELAFGAPADQNALFHPRTHASIVRRTPDIQTRHPEDGLSRAVRGGRQRVCAIAP